MRDRTEIEQIFKNIHGDGPTTTKDRLILEVLLDIREFFEKKEKSKKSQNA